MNSNQKASTAALLALSLVGAVVAQENQEKKIKRSDLPAAVKKTVEGLSKDGHIRELSEEIQNGNTTYEVEMIVSGHTKDVEIDPTGAITEIEEEVTMSSLSAEVKAGLVSKAAGGAILKVESITKHGKLVAYEAEIEKAGKKSEVQVGPDGRPLDHKE